MTKNDLLFALFYSAPWVIAFVVPLVGLTLLVVGRRSGSLWVAAYFLLILSISDRNYGVLDVESNWSFYARGTGTFFFPAINVMLFGLAVQAFFMRRFGNGLPVTHNLAPATWIFAAIFAGNLLVFQFLPEVRWWQMLGKQGLIHVLNFMLAVYVLFAVLKEPADLRRVIQLLLACAMLRGLWGLFRFAFLGGDPANFYANFQHIDVKLTYFDINDSLVAMLALWVAAWRLVRREYSHAWEKAFYLALVAVELLVILFSYRRTGLFGLGLAAVLFAWLQRPTVRWGLIATYVVAGLPLLIYKLYTRGQSQASGGGLLESLMPDIVVDGQLSFTQGRFVELYAAWLSILDSPWWGSGIWGAFDGSRFSELAWHGGNFTYLHSGLLHLALKAGLIGVGALLLGVGLFVVFIVRARRTLPAEHLGVFYLGAAGLVFMLPTWLFGTPLIEFRTMQMLALCTALPYLVHAVAQAERQPQAVRRPTRWGIRPLSQVMAARHLRPAGR